MMFKLMYYLRKIKPLVWLYRKFKKENELKELVGMTSIDERVYYENYTLSLYSGEGAVVDLGCWFGSTTISLAKGLEVNKRIKDESKKIYAYDQFLWEDWMEPFVKGTKWESTFKVNENFQTVFLEKTKKYKKIIVTKQADLTIEKWLNGHIEFLLVDAMKSWELLNSIQKNFYSSLIPQKSIVLHQDFCHYYTYWIHLLNFYFRQYFEPVDKHNFGSSLAFRLVATIPEEKLNEQYSLDNFSDSDVEAAFDYSTSFVLPESKGAIAAAKVMCYKDKRGIEEARNLLKEIRRMGIEHYDLDIVTKILE